MVDTSAFWLSFLFNFHLVASHISSVNNVVPDYLSRIFSPACPKVDDSYISTLFCLQESTTSEIVCLPTSPVGWQSQPRPPEVVSGSVI